MRIIYKMESVKDWEGVLTLTSLGYYWKIYRKTKGKREEVARAYYYTTDKQKALDSLTYNYKVVTGFQKDLFTI